MRSARFGAAAGLAPALLLAAGCDTGGRLENKRNVAAPLQALTAAEVDTLIARAISQSEAAGLPAVVAVTDREGEVLGVFVSGARDVNGDGIADAISESNIQTAISKAATAALFQSEEDAFTSRTAYFIVQGHFPPGVAQTAAGPLFGVQDSSVPASDVRSVAYDQNGDAVGAGISGELGGMPLFKNGAPVGGLGIDTVDATTVQQGAATLVTPVQNDEDERIAEAAVRPFAAPFPIRATNVLGDGITFPFTEAVLVGQEAALLALDAAGLQLLGLGAVDARFPVRASPLPPEDRIQGQYGVRAARRYQGRLAARFGAAAFTDVDRSPGTAFDSASFSVQGAPIVPMGSGFRGGVFGEERFPPIDSIEPPPSEGGLTLADVDAILNRGAAAADAASAAIRLPRGTSARVHVTVVDLRGNILGIFRMGDGTLFSQDVAVQKARTAAFFSTDDFAAGARGIGFLAQPFFPPGIDSRGPGPLVMLRDLVNRGKIPVEDPPNLRIVFPPARPPSDGAFDDNVLAAGTQAFTDYPAGVTAPAALDLAAARARTALGAPLLVDRPDTIPPFVSPGLQSGMQTFPGGVPLYKNGRLVGAVGASGDGVDEDDFVVYSASAGFDPPPGCRIDERGEAFIGLRIDERLAALEAAVLAHPDAVVRTVYGPIVTRERARAAAFFANGLDGVRIPYVKLPRNASER